MKHLRIWRSLLLTLSAFGLAGCGADAITAPKIRTEANPGLVTDLLGGTVTKSVLERKTPLASDITVSAIIGEQGGTISVPAAGFTLTVPRGAVSTKTAFTVTALKGSLVAYEFGPHGISFAKPLIARQALGTTQWNPLEMRPLLAGYFAERSALNVSNATALLSELTLGAVNILTQQFIFPIGHFSGYVVAW
jgi:hypothetical protein